MRRIDELHLERPFAGSRMLRDFLNREGVDDRPPPCRHADEAHGDRGDLSPAEHVETRAGPQDLSLSAARREGRAAEPGLGDGHHLYPDGARLRLSRRRRRLVQPARALAIGCRSRWRPTSASRRWRRRSAKHGKPEIFNTDQGSQFTSEAFTGVLLANKIAISMDGKGAWRDNVFVERLWKSVKYEEVYLQAYDSVGEARASLGRYLDFYNRQRPHSSLDRRTPDEAYFDLATLRGGRMNFPPPRLGLDLRSGYALPASHPTMRQAQHQQTRQNATYLSRKAVQTTGASSELRAKRDAARAAPERLLNFQVKIGGDYQCPACWIERNTRSPLCRSRVRTTAISFQCVQCGHTVTITY